MEKNIESTIEVAEEVMDGVVNTGSGFSKFGKWIAIGTVLVVGGVVTWRLVKKAKNDKKSIVDGEILGVEEPEEDK